MRIGVSMVRMTDSAGLSFVVSKNTSHLVGANQSVFMRSLISKVDRQRMFRINGIAPMN